VWLYGRSSAHGAPAVIAVHGGPAAQARPIYSPLFHYLASRGIVVAAPNIRGSTGYGKSFERLVYRDWGGGDVDDVEALRDWLVGELGVDAARVALFGSSYGGFVVLAALVRSPDRWAAAVDAYGPSNLVSFAESQPPQWRAIVRELIGDPETDAELLWERSPIRRVDRIVAPLLVIQGAHDWRVPRAESDELVAALRRLGRDVEYDVLLDEGHGLSRLESHSAAAWRVADWLEARLCGPRAASTSPKRGDTFAFSTTRGG
jgi:dipeptidyl aminopeptidase/acylaminoacyl peptidase